MPRCTAPTRIRILKFVTPPQLDTPDTSAMQLFYRGGFGAFKNAAIHV